MPRPSALRAEASLSARIRAANERPDDVANWRRLRHRQALLEGDVTSYDARPPRPSVNWRAGPPLDNRARGYEPTYYPFNPAELQSNIVWDPDAGWLLEQADDSGHIRRHPVDGSVLGMFNFLVPEATLGTVAQSIAEGVFRYVGDNLSKPYVPPSGNDADGIRG